MMNLALVGRPNVGKSTLFNRCIGKTHALVHKTPGLTIDYLEGTYTIAEKKWRLFDTAGYEGSFSKKIWVLSANVIEKADIILWVVEGSRALFPLDYEFSCFLRKHTNKPLLILANKCEGQHEYPGLAQAQALNIGPVFPVSGLHGTGLTDVEDTIMKTVCLHTCSQIETDPEPQTAPLQLALLGRPNVGKSTYLNQLLGEERALTGIQPGLTRDALFVNWRYKENAIRLVDTAGIRRTSKREGTIEQMSIQHSIKAMSFSHVVLLMLDGLSPLDQQERHLMQMILKEGRGLVLALNKWDLIHKKANLLKTLRADLSGKFPEVTEIPLVELSAKKKQHLFKPIIQSLKTYAQWNKRVRTNTLNSWMVKAEKQNPAPLVQGKENRLKYITQINIRPPTFTVYTSRPLALPRAYKRYLQHHLAKTFRFEQTPLRLLFRGSDNPYHKKGKRK